MPFEIVTPAADPLLTTAEAKAHLVVAHAEDDTLIDGLIQAAARECANRLNRALITSTWRLWLDGFPCGNAPLEIRLPPVQSIESVKYLDVDGNLVELDPEDYVVDAVSQPARITPAFGMFWPTTRGQVNAVQVEFVAGYGDPADVPQTIRQAALLLIGHWYANREQVVTGTIASELPYTVDALLQGESWGGML